MQVKGAAPFHPLFPLSSSLVSGGFFTQAQGWNDGSTYATADMLKSMLNWAMTSVAPVLGAMSIYGAIVQFMRKQNWGAYVVVGGSLLMVPALWSMVQKWAGVTLP